MDDRSLWGNQFWMYLPRDYWGRIICGEMWKGFGWVHWIDINTKEESPKDIILCIAWLRHCLLELIFSFAFVCCPWFLIKARYIFVIEKGLREEMKARLHQEELPCKCINKCSICYNSFTNTSTQSCPTNASTNAVPNAVIASQMNQPRAVMTNTSTNGVNAVTSMHQHLWEPHFART